MNLRDWKKVFKIAGKVFSGDTHNLQNKKQSGHRQNPAGEGSNALSDSFADGEFTGEVIELYLAETVAQLREMAEAVKNFESKKIARLAHAVRGNSLSVGAQKIAQLAAEIEDAALRSNLEMIESRLIQVGEELSAFSAERGN